MDRYVIMVDAGYLLRQAIELISAKASTSRADLEITEPTALVKALNDKAHATLALADKELLRVYWYDGVMSNGFTAQQRSIIDVDDVQFRAGTINGARQQKGVDSLIVTDLIELTTHHAIRDAILVTGDSDLAVGIEIAQRRGVRVGVLGVEDLAVGVSHHQSFEITSRADRVGRLGTAELAPMLRYSPAVSPNALFRPASASALCGTDQSAIAAAVDSFIRAQAASLASAVDPSTKRIDQTIDRALIHHVFTDLGKGALSAAEKVLARQMFRARV